MKINRRLKHPRGALSKSKNSFWILRTAGMGQCKWYNIQVSEIQRLTAHGTKILKYFQKGGTYSCKS